MQLRDYQRDAVNAIFAEWQTHKSTLLVLPTGLGKTIIFSEITKRLKLSGRKVLIIAHRDDLLEQAKEKLSLFHVNVSLEKAGNHGVNGEDVVLASVQTLGRQTRLNEYPPNYFDYIIIDEAHHSVTKSYINIFKYFKDAKLLGVTATPNRSDMRNLTNLYETIAFQYDIGQAIEQGWLSNINIRKCPLEIDLTGVRTSCGDYVASDLEDVLTPYLYKIAKKVDKHALGRKILVFTPTIAIGEKFANILIEKGIRARCISSKNTSEERNTIKTQLSKGELDAVCNAMLWTEGFDEPSVDCIINLRATKSVSLYTQILGRGLRINPGKENLLVLDFLWQSSRKGFDILSPQDIFFDKEDAPFIEKNLADGKEHNLFAIGRVSHEENLAEKLKNAKKHSFRGIPIKEINNPHIQYYYNEESLDCVVLKDCPPIQFLFNTNHLEWTPLAKWEVEPVTDKQREFLKSIMGDYEKYIQFKGQANQIIYRSQQRNGKNLCSYKQYNLLSKRGFKNVENWTKEDASEAVNLLVKNNWRLPYYFKAANYVPVSKRVARNNM